MAVPNPIEIMTKNIRNGIMSLITMYLNAEMKLYIGEYARSGMSTENQPINITILFSNSISSTFTVCVCASTTCRVERTNQLTLLYSLVIASHLHSLSQPVLVQPVGYRENQPINITILFSNNISSTFTVSACASTTCKRRHIPGSLIQNVTN